MSDLLFKQGRQKEKEPVDNSTRVTTNSTRRETSGYDQQYANLAETYHAQDYYVNTETIVVRLLNFRREVLRVEHPDVMKVMADLTEIYPAQG